MWQCRFESEEALDDHRQSLLNVTCRVLNKLHFEQELADLLAWILVIEVEGDFEEAERLECSSLE